MSLELNLRFPDKEHVIVRYEDEESGQLAFKNPLTPKDREDIRWYLEVYGAHSLGDPDDKEAKRITAQLPVWGKALFDAVFHDGAATRLFNRFQENEDDVRLLNVSAEHPTILALPWELLHDSSRGGVFLFNENPRISIRRRVPGVAGGRKPFKVEAKHRLHLLFVVSRPEDVSFLDPRADPNAVLDALEEHAPGCFSWEFLRPATVDALVERLEDETQSSVDFLHFDGHGIFDADGGLPERAAQDKSILQLLLNGQFVRTKAVEPTAKSAPNTGYLVFEKPDGQPDFVSAQRLGDNLHRHKVALVILSACQTAALGDNDEPMGSVAARLTATGIPAVLAMTHSVLVATTRVLFGAFYKDIARARGIGVALDNTRRYLVNHPEKYEVQRGPERKMLKLEDWFLPALYQSGADVPLLTKAEDERQDSEVAEPLTNLPARPEAGFFGRRRELWDIERWFVQGTRRITITGFGGQGKTALALEAGRWLPRTGMFRGAVIVDYSRVQSLDAVAVAVSNIGSVLGETLIDAKAADEALKKTPTLVILDNLEALGTEPLRELLDATVTWSEAGGSRVLCTTRKPDFGHAQYGVEGTLVHRRIVLEGLGDRAIPDDALEWFGELMKLPPAPTEEPPERKDIIDLFDRVRFHPLSIRVLAQQLKTRGVSELGRRLEQLLSGASAAGSPEASPSEDTPASLIASLQLSLDKLNEAAREVLPRLGVFQGGAMEKDLLAITEISEQLWPALRRQLEAAALIEAETLPGVTVPFLLFHPTLAPMLWTQLTADEQANLTTAHRKRYYRLADYLYWADDKIPSQARAIALRELPNLLHGVDAALDVGEPDAVEFTERVNKFLDCFGLRQESDALVRKAQGAAGRPGSDAWYLAQSICGRQLLAARRVEEAAEVFRALLETLRDTPSYERAATLGYLGECATAGGRPDLAAQHARDAITVLEQLAQTDGVKRERGACLFNLGVALVEQGEYADARTAYEEALRVANGLGDLRHQGAVVGQLGTLALLEGKLDEALQRHRAALALCQQLQEPATEAVSWHQLGRVFEEAEDWDEAERHYREAARIGQQQGNLAGAAKTWNQLAFLGMRAGKPNAAEMWHRKAIEVDRQLGNPKELAIDVSNLANVLLDLPGRLGEARQLAEEALGIKRTLDPGATGIWLTYYVLAEVAEKEAEATSDGQIRAERQAEASEYRRLAREAKRDFAGTRHELKKHAEPIVATVAACSGRTDAREAVRGYQTALREGPPHWRKLADVLDRLLAGERDAELLCDALEYETSMVVEAILEALRDPSTLKDLLPDQKQE